MNEKERERRRRERTALERGRENAEPARYMHRSLSAGARDKATIAVFVVRRVVARRRRVGGQDVALRRKIAPCETETSSLSRTLISRVSSGSAFVTTRDTRSTDKQVLPPSLCPFCTADVRSGDMTFRQSRSNDFARFFLFRVSSFFFFSILRPPLYLPSRSHSR